MYAPVCVRARAFSPTFLSLSAAELESTQQQGAKHLLHLPRQCGHPYSNPLSIHNHVQEYKWAPLSLQTVLDHFTPRLPVLKTTEGLHKKKKNPGNVVFPYPFVFWRRYKSTLKGKNNNTKQKKNSLCFTNLTFGWASTLLYSCSGWNEKNHYRSVIGAQRGANQRQERLFSAALICMGGNNLATTPQMRTPSYCYTLTSTYFPPSLYATEVYFHTHF